MVTSLHGCTQHSAGRVRLTGYLVSWPLTHAMDVQGKTAGKDLLSDKATYPALLGMERSREIAAELITEAKKGLGTLGA